MLLLQTKAPGFVLRNQDNQEISLDAFQGEYVVLYFYPKDDTAGCTKEACSIRDNYGKLQTMAVILGVSADSVESHKQFAEKYHLPFTLLSDPNKETIKKYQADGVFTKRITYLISPEGIIIKTYPKVDPSQHAEQILKDLEFLKKH